MIGKRVGPYEVTAKLGEGGMGEVFRARDTKLERDVAIKVLPQAFVEDAERLERFEREAKLLAQLNHPNIAHIYGMEASGASHALVLELVEGPTLAERLESGSLPIDEALSLARQIAEALEAAHEKGIVHRDLKPQNIKASNEGKVKVLDFGLAKAMDPVGAASAGDVARSPTLMNSPTLTAAGTQLGVILGTAAYMAPEQAKGAAVDKRADIWAFGVVVYEMLSGARLFQAPTVPETLAHVLTRAIDLDTLPASTPVAIRQLLRRCLERNPKNRLRDVGDARLVLDEVLGGWDEAPATPAPAARAPGRRAWLVGTAAALAALALGWLAGRSGLGAGDSEATSSPVTYQRLTFQPGNFVNARFGPDGETAFLATDWRGPVREIFQVRPGAGELAIGVTGAEFLAVSRQGELALLLPRVETGNPWVVQGTLAVVSSSGGTPRELAEDVVAADWLPDGEGLAALRVAGAGLELEFPLGSPVYRLPSWGAKLRVSPTGDAVAFFERLGLGEYSIAVVDRSGRRETWSTGWTDWWGLAWSPDGREIWFSASKSGLAANVYAVDRKGALRTLLAAPGTIDLHDVAADGSALTARVAFSSSVLLESAEPAGAERDLSWLETSAAVDLAADGRHVLLGIESEREPGRSAVYLRATDGSPPIRIGYGWPQELSHDGRWALAARGGTLVAMPTGPGAERTVDTGLPEILAARWLPDDQSVVLLGRDRSGSAVARVIGFAGEVARDLAKGFEPRYLAGLNRALSPVSPDGRSVAFAVDGGIALLPLDGTAPRSLPGGEASDQPIQWSADGRRLVLFDPRGLPSHLFELDLASGRRELVAEVGPADLAGVAGITTALATPDLSLRVLTFQRFRSDLYRVEGLR